MDLSFPRFDQDSEVADLPPDLAVLMVGIAARQAASPTALFNARLPSEVLPDWFAPVEGAFNAPMAQLIAKWGRI